MGYLLAQMIELPSEMPNRFSKVLEFSIVIEARICLIRNQLSFNFFASCGGFGLQILLYFKLQLFYFL